MYLTERTISAFPISIGTSLSLESVFTGRLPPYDPIRQIPQHININHYQESWFNIATLYRNLIGALPNEAKITVKPEALAADILEEIDVITSLYKNEGNDICKPYFYHCTYEKVVSKYSAKKIQFRQIKTEKQKEYERKYAETIKFILKDNEFIKKFNSDIKPIVNCKALIMTHVPYDLISYKKFSQLDLLESHTGKLKSRYEFSTKYHPLGDEKLDFMPFLEKLLFIFGDKVFIEPTDIKLRRLIVDIAKNREWTPYTSEEKVNYFIESDIQETYLKNWILSL
jgi:hypothetical protein